MKPKIICILLAFMVCCAIQNIKTDSTIFDGKTFDQVWNASMLAANDVGFTIVNSDKNSGIIITTKEANLATQEQDPQMNIIIQKSATGINVYCKYLEKGQIMNIFHTPEKDIKKFMVSLERRLQISN